MLLDINRYHACINMQSNYSLFTIFRSISIVSSEARFQQQERAFIYFFHNKHDVAQGMTKTTGYTKHTDMR